MFTACGVMHPRCCRPVTWMRGNSASSNLDAEFLLHLVGGLHYLHTVLFGNGGFQRANLNGSVSIFDFKEIIKCNLLTYLFSFACL